MTIKNKVYSTNCESDLGCAKATSEDLTSFNFRSCVNLDDGTPIGLNVTTSDKYGCICTNSRFADDGLGNCVVVDSGILFFQYISLLIAAIDFLVFFWGWYIILVTIVRARTIKSKVGWALLYGLLSISLNAFSTFFGGLQTVQSFASMNHQVETASSKEGIKWYNLNERLDNFDHAKYLVLALVDDQLFFIALILIIVMWLNVAIEIESTKFKGTNITNTNSNTDNAEENSISRKLNFRALILKRFLLLFSLGTLFAMVVISGLAIAKNDIRYAGSLILCLLISAVVCVILVALVERKLTRALLSVLELSRQLNSVRNSEWSHQLSTRIKQIQKLSRRLRILGLLSVFCYVLGEIGFLFGLSHSSSSWGVGAKYLNILFQTFLLGLKIGCIHYIDGSYFHVTSVYITNSSSTTSRIEQQPPMSESNGKQHTTKNNMEVAVIPHSPVTSEIA